MPLAAGIEYAEAGSGPAIICLHGIGGNTESFRPQLEGLSDDHHVIAWNMPGFGRSAPLAEMTFGSLACSLRDFMDALGLEQAVIMGQSIGGMIAQEMAIRFPDRVVKLVLVATTPAFGGRDESFKDQFLAARQKPLDDGKTLADLATSFVPDIVGPKAEPEIIASATASMAAVPEATYRQVLKCLVTFNRRDEITSIRQPTLLLAGSHDTNSPAKTMQKMAEKMPNAKCHVIDGAGHLVNLEAPAETNQLVRRFLQGRQAKLFEA